MSKRDEFRQKAQTNGHALPSASLDEAAAWLYGQLENVGGTDDSSSPLAVLEDGTIRVGAFVLTPTGLQIQGAVSADEWQSLGTMLNKLDQSIQWLIGDWIVYGAREWGQSYEAIANTTGKDVKTLYNYAYVAAQVHFSSRRASLSFGHHALVAPMKPALQEQWLAYAEDQRLSIAKLRQAIDQASKSPVAQNKIEAFSSRYTSFGKHALSLAKDADTHERHQMAEMLRQLADQIDA